MALFFQIKACATAQDTDTNEQTVQLALYPSAPLENSSGSLWFSTVLHGIIRYDGKNFINITRNNPRAALPGPSTK